MLGGDVFWSHWLIGQLLGGSDGLACGARAEIGYTNDLESCTVYVYGAVIPILLVCMMYVGFSASGTVLVGRGWSVVTCD